MNLSELKKQQDKKYITRIADYLLDRVNKDEVLKEKIENTSKTLEGCLSYVKEEARKQAQNGCAVIEDEEVYGWVVHYFLEDNLKEKVVKKTTPPTTEKDIEKYNNQSSPTTSKKSKNKKEAKEIIMEQLPLFDL